MFAVIGRARKALRKAGQPDKADEFFNRAMKAASYDEVVQLAMTYCEVQ